MIPIENESKVIMDQLKRKSGPVKEVNSAFGPSHEAFGVSKSLFYSDK